MCTYLLPHHPQKSQQQSVRSSSKLKCFGPSIFTPSFSCMRIHGCHTKASIHYSIALTCCFRLCTLHLVFWYTYLQEVVTAQCCEMAASVCNTFNACRDSIQHWKKRGVHLLAWTIQDKQEAQYLSKELGVPVLMDDACKLD